MFVSESLTVAILMPSLSQIRGNPMVNQWKSYGPLLVDLGVAGSNLVTHPDSSNRRSRTFGYNRFRDLLAPSRVCHQKRQLRVSSSLRLPPQGGRATVSSS